MHPKHISIHDFSYTLPEEKIAKYPLPQRDASRLLVYQRGSITEDSYNHLGEHIPPGSLLVFNNTKVVEARLLFQKPTGGMVEIFCLEPHDRYGDVTNGMLQTGKVLWKCLIGGAGKWKHGQVLCKEINCREEKMLVEARYIEKLSDSFIIELSWSPPSLSFAELLHSAGLIPLPPYIKRTPDAADSNRYQTVYAKEDGSVAAPTAGLHFTAALLEQLTAKGIQQCYISLHVGAGTFKPVKAATMEGHDMHGEFIHVSVNAIRQLLAFSGKIYAVGTTSLRTLESIYWMGVKTIIDPSINPINISIGQWDVYDTKLPKQIPVTEALESLLHWLDKHNMQDLVTKTRILIAPGYTIQMISGLITNFHQPQSTLLLLVAALIDDEWRKVYNYALENNFRFLSYGDGCLLKL